MSLFFKKGVRVFGLHPESLYALDVAEAIFAELEKDCVCTSTRYIDNHSGHSHHFKGHAVDLRTRHLTSPEKIEVAERLEERLGPEYQVVIHASHIHVEYDPIGPLDYPRSLQ